MHVTLCLTVMTRQTRKHTVEILDTMSGQKATLCLDGFGCLHSDKELHKYTYTVLKDCFRKSMSCNVKTIGVIFNGKRNVTPILATKKNMLIEYKLTVYTVQ